MPSSGWRALGSGSILGHLRKDLKGARRQVRILGPWIDDFFADVVVNCLPATPALQVVSRPPGRVGGGFAARGREACALFLDRANTEIRLHDCLHAKVILIDETIAYCGSANWYRYSLEDGCEIVLRGATTLAPDLPDQAQTIWDAARPLGERPQRTTRPGQKVEGQRVELDPIAAEVVRTIPGVVVLGEKNKLRR